MKKIKKQAGFTIIELLITMSIMALLSSIVLVTLKDARSKADDAKTIEMGNLARTAAEVYLGNNGNYGNPPVPAAACQNANTGTAELFKDTSSAMATYTDVNNYRAGTTFLCASDGANYALSISLSESGQYWCVDNKGASRKIGIGTPGSVLSADASCAAMDQR